MAGRAQGKKSDDVQAMRDERDHLRRQLTLFAGLARRLAATLDPIAVLREVVEAGCELTGARYGALGVFTSDGRIQQFVTEGVSDTEREAIGDLPRGHGLLGLLQKEQRPLRLEDISKHKASVGFPENHPPMKSFMGVPIRYETEALGNLYLTEKAEGASFTDEDEELLLLLADQASMAIHNARLHQAAEDERTQLRTLIDTTPVGVFVVHLGNPEVRLVNREAARLLGVRAHEGTALQEHERVSVYRRADGTEYAADALPVSRALYQGERVTAEEFRVEMPDGTVVPTLVNATPVHDVDGNITGAIAVIQDITPIEELERLRNEFLGMVSHELKTPLTAIKGSAAMALGSGKSLNADEAQELFEIIDEQSDRLRDLVDNLLDVTRIEAGTLSVTPQPLALQQVIEEALATMAHAPGSHEVLVPDLDGAPAVLADQRRLGQVLNNLLSNAAKFSPDGSPIELLAEFGAGRVTLGVKDQGRGFAEGQAKQLFTKFSQLPDEHGRVSTGPRTGARHLQGHRGGSRRSYLG